MVSQRIPMALILAGVITFGASIIAWVGVRPGATTATPIAKSSSGAAPRKNRERFFGGEPDRDVHGGQEMKPRW